MFLLNPSMDLATNMQDQPHRILDFTLDALTLQSVNYVLSTMQELGAEYAKALKKDRKKGKKISRDQH